MKWIELQSLDQLNDLQKESDSTPVLIFKHSRRCNISRASLDRLERNWKDSDGNEIKPYFLDLLDYREISNTIADVFQVEHESPQVLLIHKGKAVFHQSHFEIDYNQIKSAVRN